MIINKNAIYFPKYNININNDYSTEVLSYLSSGFTGKIYFEFQFVVPSVAYHTEASVEYSHSAHKVGFILFTKTDQHRIRDHGPHSNYWIEFGYLPAYGYCISKWSGVDTDNQAILSYAVPFDNPNTDAFTHSNDVLGLEIDVVYGTLDNFYINGVKQTLSDPNASLVTNWYYDPVEYQACNAYACMVNLPYVSAGATYTDISPSQEMCVLKLNSGSADFRYGPSPGYEACALYDYYYFGNPYVPASNRNIIISETATITLTNSISTGTEKWYTIKWVDSGEYDPEVIRGELTLDFSGSDLLADCAIYAYIDRCGSALWHSSWSRDDVYPNSKTPVDKFVLLNKKTYYMCLGFELQDNPFNVVPTQGKWAYALSGGSHVMSARVTLL